MENNSEIVIYKTDDGNTSIDVKLQDDTVWLTRKQMAQLFDKDVNTIGEHINNIYNVGELQKPSSPNMTGNSGFVRRPAVLYDLDMIISVGYRVNSKRGIMNCLTD